MAINDRPKATKKRDPNKPLPPVKMYVVAPQGTNMDEVHLVRKQRDLNAVLLNNRTSAIKEFTFEREARGSGDAA